MTRGAEGDPKQTGPRPGALSALLQEIAAAPREGQGGAWEATLRPGATVGRFEMVRELGSGGFGVVWEARDLELGRSVAFKAVRAGAQAALREERLLREAEAAARLQHPNIVTLFDVGRASKGRTWCWSCSGGNPRGAAGSRTAAAGRGRARRHRDRRGGGARAREGRDPPGPEARQRLPVPGRSGEAAGFRDGARLRPPEGGGRDERVHGARADRRGARGRADGRLGARAILHEALSGRRAFEDEKAMRRPAPSLEVPGAPGLGELVGRMLSPRPVERPRDGREVLAALSSSQGEAGGAPAHGPVRMRRRPGRRRVVLLGVGIAAGLGIASVSAWWAAHRPGPSLTERLAEPSPTPSIAVLPFADMSPGKDQEYLSDGISEEILNALARVEGLRVVGRTSSWYFKGKNAKLADIGRELKVASVLEGAMRRDGNRIRVTATIVNVGDGFHAWSETWDRDLRDILAVESEIAREVVEALKVRLLGGRRPAVPDRPRTTAEAHLHALRGRQAFQRGSATDLARAVEAYEKAVAVDPRFSSAWAGLALARAWDAESRPTLDALLAEKCLALEAADRAVATGPALPEGYVARAVLRGLHRGEWAEARADAEKAMSLGGGGDASAAYARVLGMTGQLPEAMAAAERCAELQPLETFCLLRVGFYANGLGQFDRARQAFQRVIDIAPDNAYASGFLAQTLLLEGRPQDALSEAARSRGMEPFRITAVALAQHSLGRVDESRRAFDDLVGRYAHSMSFQIAEVCAWRGDPDCAFWWLERAAERLDMGVTMVTFSPFLRSIRSDPRYAALLRKLKLPAE